MRERLTRLLFQEGENFFFFFFFFFLLFLGQGSGKERADAIS
jgi:hypothetical protein